MSPADGVVQRVAVLGAGLIGRSWAALFLAAGKTVTVYDPDPAAEAKVHAAIEATRPVLRTLGLTGGGDLVVGDDPRTAVRDYESVGKTTIEVRREVPGHVANRLQAALWREAIHLVNEGVATVRDIDTAVSAGPGIRWAAMGPTMLFHLGGDEGGLAAFCERYADSFNRWWDDLGTPHLDRATAGRLVAGLSGESTAILAERRDALIAAIIASRGAA